MRLNSPKSNEIEADKGLWWAKLGFGATKPKTGVNVKTATAKRMVKKMR